MVVNIETNVAVWWVLQELVRRGSAIDGAIHYGTGLTIGRRRRRVERLVPLQLEPPLASYLSFTIGIHVVVLHFHPREVRIGLRALDPASHARDLVRFVKIERRAHDLLVWEVAT